VLQGNPLIHVKAMSAGFDWLTTAVTVVTAVTIWQRERALRMTKNAKAFSLAAAFATIVTLVAIVLTVIQLREIPEIVVSTNDSRGMAYTAYDSAFMALVGSGLIHLVILAFLGLGLTVRASRGLVTGERWYQARLIRMFWVGIAISSVVVADVTTTINTIH
jgi:heme/copper-type cytochrome/quinol oxidase subunit 3